VRGAMLAVANLVSHPGSWAAATPSLCSAGPLSAPGGSRTRTGADFKSAASASWATGAGPVSQPASATARAKTASSIGSVSLPVNVFCWLGW
jgi:hypothetical protein